MNCIVQLPENRPALMGIVNVTPDSFSDGGVHFRAEDAIAAGLRMVEEGADLVDVGGESTRPGAAAVAAEEELRRVVPVVEALARQGVAVSIDTMKPEVARAALDAGAKIVNDVTAFSNPEMARIAAGTGCTVCLMHMKGDPRTMQENPVYGDIVAEIRDYLVERAAFAEGHGVARETIWIDPGIGFGKTVRHNLLLLKRLEVFVETGYPVLVGVSRKSFIGRLLNPENPVPVEERLEGTLAAQVIAQTKGARILRVHDVKPARRAIEIVAAIEGV
ncbi:MAG TPA: dihydropteroate synthase [Fimbriimonadaceae bacterium]|nr:dihydropteroate synthase [Fimbriimonadaceae bacterium]